VLDPERERLFDAQSLTLSLPPIDACGLSETCPALLDYVITTGSQYRRQIHHMRNAIGYVGFTQQWFFVVSVDVGGTQSNLSALNVAPVVELDEMTF